ncbi:unnamed protein product [Prorocentrum cordatum]|uniref:Uncharacterized protein n=1 Tax=Prorocentrum cordatum TaxID=2364126 RepID=A0ABN9YAC4_9DINO|nr:unnamed protein product [Polarella glacialis]
MLDDKASLGPELAYRDREASGAMRALRRAVAKAPGKDMPPKLHLLDALSVNAAMYSAGTWYEMTKAETLRLQTQSWQAPWGVTELTPRQQLQVAVSNDLLQANEEAEVQELRRFFVDSNNMALNAPVMGPDFAGLVKSPRPPSALARISASLETESRAHFPTEEEEIEGTHTVAMAHLDADETAITSFGTRRRIGYCSLLRPFYGV